MKRPLVSIVVVTYNSAQFVLETLESAKAQTYKNIELIISDDGSIDNTVALCEGWLNKNNNEFINAQLITVSQNSGISANCNRGVKAARGEWIKLIAGDDILMENCIEANIDFIQDKDCAIVFSNVIAFEIEADKLNVNNIRRGSNEFFNQSAAKQFYILLSYCPIGIAASSFMSSRVLKELDYFDEEFPLMEDYPLWTKATRNGFSLKHFDRVTVYYRVHPFSITASYNSVNSIVDKYFFKNEKFRIKHNYQNYTFFGITFKKYQYFINKIFINAPNNTFNRLFYKAIIKINPLYVVYYIAYRIGNIDKLFIKKKYRV